jgi:hypothetical protein
LAKRTLRGKKRKISSEPFFSGAMITTIKEITRCTINNVQVALKSILASKDLFVVGTMAISAIIPMKARGSKK